VVFGDPALRTDGEVLALAFAGDGVLWSVEETGMLRRWDGSSGRPTGWKVLSDLETLWCFSPDARWLASGSDCLTLWETASGRRVGARAQPSWVTALAFAPGVPFLAAGHDDGSVRCWDVPDGRLLREFPGRGSPVSALAFGPGGTHLAAAWEDR